MLILNPDYCCLCTQGIVSYCKDRDRDGGVSWLDLFRRLRHAPHSVHMDVQTRREWAQFKSSWNFDEYVEWCSCFYVLHPITHEVFARSLLGALQRAKYPVRWEVSVCAC